MFKKLFILFILFYQLGYANVCVISNENDFSNCNETISYLIDTDKAYSKDFLPPIESYVLSNKLFLGHLNYPVWSKLEIKYTGTDTKSVIFYNPKVLTDYLEVFVYKNGILIQRNTLGDMVEPKIKKKSSRYSAFELTFEPNQTYQIITNIKHKGAFDIRWNVKTSFNFDTFITHETIIIGVFVGLLIAIIFYSLLIYKATKDNIYLFYSLHIFFMFLYQIANTNILYQFEVMLGGYFIWIVAFLSFATLLLFGKTYINTKETHPFVDKYLKFMIFLFITMAFYFFLASNFNNLMWFRKFFIWSSIVFIILSIFILSYVAIVKKIQGTTYYIIGHAGYIICISYPHLENILAQHFQINSFYTSIGGILFDVIFLSIALNKKIAYLHHKNIQQNELLIIQSSFTNVGKTLANISHQYKTPLAHLSILATSLEAYLFKTDHKDPLLKDITQNMRKSLSFMDETMKNFNDFYKNSNVKESFAIDNEINYVIGMLQERITGIDVKFDINIPPEYKFYGYKNAFDNVIIILIENALDIFEKRKIQSPLIQIKVTTIEHKIVIAIEDNGGGILIMPIDSIFKTFISSKEKSSGLGLALIKMLVKERLDGTISVSNTTEGAEFIIELPL